MNSEQQFADWINESPSETGRQLVYADWLEEQCDPRGEAWRVLIEAGKRPYFLAYGKRWLWTWTVDVGEKHNLKNVFASCPAFCMKTYKLFFDAMNAACIAWVRCHRDPEYDPLGMMGVTPE